MRRSRRALAVALVVATVPPVTGCYHYRLQSHLRAHRKLAEQTIQKRRERGEQSLEVPPLPPTSCVAPHVWHYNHYLCCTDVTTLDAPPDEAQAVEHFRNAILNHQRIHTLGAAHTGNDGICTKGMVLRTTNLNHALRIENFHGHPTVVAEAGITIYDLNQWLHERGYSLGMGTLEFRDASIAGAIATGAHGSTLRGSSVLSSQVESLWIATPADVVAQGSAFREAREFSADNLPPIEWRAMRTGLGLFGLVTKVRLRIEKEFNLDVRITTNEDSGLLAPGGLERIAGDCDWGQIIWFPRIHRYVAMCGARTDKDVDREAENILLTPDAVQWEADMFIGLLNQMVRSKGDYCPEDIRDFALETTPPQRKRCLGMLHSVTRAIGYAYKMVSSAMSPLQLSAPQNDFEVAIPMAKSEAVLKLISHTVERENLCLPLTGVFLRFTRADETALIAHSTADADAPNGSGMVFVEYVVFRPNGTAPNAGDSVFGPYWRLTERLIREFGGRLHWGKNQRDLFTFQRDQNGLYRQRLDQFREIIERFDPTHILATPFSDAVGLTQP